MNRLTQSIAYFCRQYLTAEKWLIAPSLRVGHQWLDAVSRSGQAAVNVRVKNLRGAALELASPEMSRRGLKLISNTGGEVIIDHVWDQLQTGGRGYLFSLKPGRSLFASILFSIKTLRLAGLLAPSQIKAAGFETPAKGTEMTQIMARYLAELEAGKWIDYAAALEMATAYLEDESLSREAEYAVVKIAEGVGADSPELAKETLKKIIERTKNDTLRDRAQEVLVKIQ